MTIEYVLLISLFALFILSALVKGPHDSFKKAGPKLGARVERHIITGDGFKPNGNDHRWENPQ